MMSLIQSPSMSPIPLIVHARLKLPKLTAWSMVNCGVMNHTSISLVEVLRHRISADPSPSRSPTAWICHDEPAPTLAGKNALAKLPLPLIFQIATCPVDGWNHTISEIPSPSMSPVPAAVQLVSTPGGQFALSDVAVSPL